jgi:TP901 family phage tail tape measure protein
VSDYNLGTATGTIRFDYDGQAAALQAQHDLDTIEKKGMSSSKAWGKVSTAMLGAGAVLVGGLALATKSAADFEQGLSNIRAVSGATEAEMEKIRQTALRLGADTQYSAGEAASAMEELIKAGISTKDVMNGAADATVNLAAAGEVDLTTAAGIAANAMNTFQLAARDMPHVADLLAGAANASSTDVTALGEALKYAGPAASAAGLSIDDVTTSLSVFAKYGIEGSMAGTSFRGMLLNLQPSTDAAASAMRKLGILTKDGTNQFLKANGEYKSMADISEVLQGATEGLTKAETARYMNIIFGDRAMGAAIALSREGTNGFNKMADAMGKVTAADVAAEKMDNLKGSIEQMMGSIETAAIIIGTAFLPVVRAVVDFFTGLVNAFSALPGPVQTTIVAIIAAVGVLLLIAGAVIKMILAIKAAQAAWVALNISFSVSPIGIIIVAIIALIAILVLLYKKNETVRNFINAAWEGIKNAVMAVVDFLVPYLSAAWEAIKAAAAAAWGFIQKYIVPVLQVIWNAIQTYAKLWWAAVQLYFNLIKTVVTTVWNFIKNVIIPGAIEIWGIIRTYLGLVWKFWSTVFNAISLIVKIAFALIKGVIMGVMAFLEPFIRVAWKAISSIIKAAMKVIVPIVKVGWALLKAVTQTVWNFIKGIIQRFWPPVKAIISAGVAFIKEKWAQLKALIAIVTGIFSRILDSINEKIDRAKEIVENLPDIIKNIFSDAGQWLYDAGKAIIQGLIDGITAMFGELKEKVESVTGFIADHFPGSPAKKGPLSDHGGYEMRHRGQALVAQLLEGIDDKQKLNREMNSFVRDLNSTMLAPGSRMNNINVMPSRVNVPAPQIIQHVYGDRSRDSLDVSARRLANIIEGGVMR